MVELLKKIWAYLKRSPDPHEWDDVVWDEEAWPNPQPIGIKDKSTH